MSVKVREHPKGSGTYYIFIDHRGRRKSKKIGRDKKTAEKIARQVEAKLVLGELSLEQFDHKPKFEEVAMSWLNEVVAKRLKKSTFSRYEGILEKYLLPRIGKRHIDQISRSDVRKLLLSIHDAGLSDSTVSISRDVMSGVFKQAVDDEIIPVNPVAGISRGLNLGRKTAGRFDMLDFKEAKHFLAVCQEHFPDYYAFFLCALRTGLRLGELLALEWNNVDFNSRFVRVEKSYRYGLIGSTKTGRSRRVDMSDQLAEELGRLLTVRKEEALQAGQGEVVAVIFHRNGKHMEQNFIRRIYIRILKKAGIRTLRVHDLRHSFASMLLSNGESPVYVKEQMGHSSISTTVDIYGHLIPSSNRNAVNRLDDSSSPIKMVFDK